MSHFEEMWGTAALQSVFRSTMNAFSYPGRIFKLGSESSPAAVLSLMASLLDNQVTLSDGCGCLPQKFINLTDAKIAPSMDADFVILSGVDPDRSQPFKSGTLSNPEESATLVLIVNDFNTGQGFEMILEGPGVLGTQSVQVEGLDQAWISIRNEQCASFPLGVDYIFCSETSIFALPRSTQVHLKQGL